MGFQSTLRLITYLAILGSLSISFGYFVGGIFAATIATVVVIGLGLLYKLFDFVAST